MAAPNLHSFRRFFALACLRGGMDVISMQRLSGHANLAIINRYLRQTEGDLQAAHEKAGPVKRLWKRTASRLLFEWPILAVMR